MGGGAEAPPPVADPRGGDRLQQHQQQQQLRRRRAGRMAGYAPRLPWLLPLLRRAAPPPWARAAGGAAGLRALPRPASRCGTPAPLLLLGAPCCRRLLLPAAAAGSAPRCLSAAADAEPPPAPPRGAAGAPPRFEAWRLLALAHPERWRLTAAVGFLTVSSVITMSAPFFLGKVIDVIYTNPSEDFTDSLTSLCALLSGIFLCGAAANATRVYLMQTAGQRIVKRLRTTMFSSILKQETAFFDKTRTGELINRLSSDTALLGRSVTENLSDGLRAGAQASVGVGMMFFVSPSLAAFVLSVVPPLAVLAVIYGRYLRKLTKMTQDSLAEATQLAEERVGNIRTVRAFGQEVAEMEQYTNKVDYVLQLAKKEALARAGFFGATGLSGNLIILSVLYKGGLLMGSAYMTVGELSSFLMYAFWVGISIGGLSSFYSELMKGLGAGGRLWELIERKPQLPFNGTITVDGFDIRQLNPLWFRTKIGTVSQEPVLFSCSIAENIAYGAEDPSTVTAEEIQKVAEIANAASFIRDFPKGFDTVVGEKGILLSGGQKQRIAIARALLKNPKILLLDEATSALDAENEYLVQEALDRLMEGRTVLIIAHRLSTIQNADFVAVLGQGKILECGKHEELLANPNGLFRKLMQKQAFLQNSDTFALDLQSREKDVLKENV
ncbi:ATP-binding cassette sub-family B member 10, mitochondrial isoform X2 [Athene noctua]|uniref:ATP-binding cassette sub-family B member 10, mitochondrial isoform X2 n=1 Tax=Athene noctua TaxID=126797 RepID=UPI003EBEEF1E